MSRFAGRSVHPSIATYEAHAIHGDRPCFAIIQKKILSLSTQIFCHYQKILCHCQKKFSLSKKFSSSKNFCHCQKIFCHLFKKILSPFQKYFVIVQKKLLSFLSDSDLFFKDRITLSLLKRLATPSFQSSSQRKDSADLLFDVISLSLSSDSSREVTRRLLIGLDGSRAIARARETTGNFFR